MSKPRIIGFLVLLSIIGVSISSAISIDGAVFRADVAPGQHVTHVITLGKSDIPLNFTVKVMGFGQTLEGDNAQLEDNLDVSPYTARPFLRVNVSNFQLDPGQSQKILLEGDIPANVGSGGRYALVVFRSIPNSNKTIKVITGVDIPILLTIAGPEQINKGEITDLKVEEPVSAQQQNVSMTFKNTGNYHYRAQANASLMDKNGNILGNFSSPVSTGSIIPTTSRLFEIKVNPSSPLKPGTYNVKASVNFEDGAILATKETSFEIKS